MITSREARIRVDHLVLLDALALVLLQVKQVMETHGQGRIIIQDVARVSSPQTNPKLLILNPNRSQSVYPGVPNLIRHFLNRHH
jgi:hypothetical protein